MVISPSRTKSRTCKSSKLSVEWHDILTVNLVASCARGYPQLAAVLDSEENMMLYRRFGFLQARLLLHKQDQLRKLETALDRLDKKYLAENADLLISRERDDCYSEERKTLLLKIEEAFREYG